MLQTEVSGWTKDYKLLKEEEFYYFEICFAVWYKELNSMIYDLPNLFEITELEHPIQEYIMESFVDSYRIEMFGSTDDEEEKQRLYEATYEIISSDFDDFARRFMHDIKLYITQRRFTSMYKESDIKPSTFLISPTKEVW